MRKFNVKKDEEGKFDQSERRNDKILGFQMGAFFYARHGFCVNHDLIEKS